MITSDPQTDLVEALTRANVAEKELDRLQKLLAQEAEKADRRVRHKISILRLIFTGITALMGFLGILVVINWTLPEAVDKDGVGATFFQTSKDILLVLAGILGSAMANVFDSRSGVSKEEDVPVQRDEG